MKKILIICLVLVSISSCDTGEPPTPDSDVPELPANPESTFVMDFSIVDANSGGRTTAKANWGRSAIIVGVWSLLATTVTAVPVASFREAFNHTPTFDANLPGWIWQYDVQFGQLNYNARLESEVTNTGVNWNMFVTLDGEFEDFNWYSGTTNLTATSGHWILNASPNDAQQGPVLRIDWNRNEDRSPKDIKYTNVRSGDDNENGSIFFEITDGTTYNRYYELLQVQENNTISIEWHSENKNGRVKDPLHYEDEEYRCRDENLDDVDCS